MKFYISKETKVELEATINSLQKINNITEDNDSMLVIKIYQKVLADCVVLPLKNSLEEIIEDMSTWGDYPEGLIIDNNAPKQIHKPYVVEFAGVDSKGGFVRLFSEQQHKQNDYFKIVINKETYYYQLKTISVVDGGYELELKETGYWATTTKQHGVDLNDIMHQTVIPVTDEKEREDIYKWSCWC